MIKFLGGQLFSVVCFNLPDPFLCEWHRIQCVKEISEIPVVAHYDVLPGRLFHISKLLDTWQKLPLPPGPWDFRCPCCRPHWSLAHLLGESYNVAEEGCISKFVPLPLLIVVMKLHRLPHKFLSFCFCTPF